MGSHCGDFGDEDTAEGVCEAYVAVAEDEFYALWGYFEDLALYP